MNNCDCVDRDEVMYQGAYYCSICFTQIDSVIFEETMLKDDNCKTRKVKFENLLFTTEDLPWYVRQTLLDCFSQIENHFYESERINFINMNQLAIELCNQCGYGEYSHLFKSLKTKNRIKQVSAFVEQALSIIKINEKPKDIFRLEDMKFIEPLGNEIDFRKVPRDEHMFSDKNEKN